MNIIKISHLVAIDENGETYKLLDFPDSTYEEEIIYSDVEGDITTEEQQDKYEDGSYARSYTEYKYFKIKFEK